MSEENKRIVRRFPLEVFNEGKVDVVDEIQAPDMIEHQPPPPGLPGGIEGFKGFVQAYRQAFPDLHYEILTELEEGDKVATVVTVTGTMKGDFAGMPASGKSATWTEIHVARLKDGKVVEHWGVIDQLGMLAQLGFAGAPQGAPAGASAN
jgi:steroid delta-isomerase-like uncharacterized protein